MVGPSLVHFQTFLHRRAARIKPSTYLGLGAAIPRRFCPDFGYNFQPVNNAWPTPVNPLPPFATESLISMDTKDYAIVTLDIHGNRPAPIQALLTHDER
jgi:hypothetical protein